MITSQASRHDLLFLNRLALANPESSAVVDLSVASSPIRITYGELNELSDRAAQGLLDLGVQEGENVAYLMPNRWEFIVLTLAVWKIGAVACPMLPAMREREIPFVVGRAKSKVLVIPDAYRNFQYGPLIQKILPDMPNLRHVITVAPNDPKDLKNCLGGLASREPDREWIARRRPDPNAPAQLLFTSGTTGEPKGVIHTHRTLSDALAAHVEALGLTAKDTIWVPSPMGHQTGLLYGMMLAMYLGAKQVCQSAWDVETARVAIERHGATFVQAAMPFLADIAHDARPPQGLKIFVATGAPVPRKLAEEARRRLDCKVVGGWGSTETCMISIGSVKQYEDSSWRTDGQVIPGRQMKVVDEQGRALPPGKEGLFKVKTTAMFTSYLDHPEWYEAAVDAEGFFNTGDLAVIDEQGNLNLTGRVKDIVNRGGLKIPVSEIENLLYRMEGIGDAAIVGMPDDRLNERICAYVSLSNPQRELTLTDVTAYMQAQGVTKSYWPERVEILPELPRTSTGKIQKYVLRQLISDKLRAE
ncbi:AMP-binding protein [Paenibacillus glycinis]|uniref:AMP-binding protein n=1 Tax=Paenibacillus glycinis TaxID=2697035 RepID=A0ABW9XK86_9BACL|nr:AMP-binding protein [Paenibacillus glycinis]NBD23012.1 AMP-binding protein [Paenibacillus glycinis]